MSKAEGAHKREKERDDQEKRFGLLDGKGKCEVETKSFRANPQCGTPDGDSGLPAHPVMADRSVPTRKVLIVEDEPSIRNVLYVLLTSLGYEGDVAHSSHQALAMVSRDSFDAVLLDLRCPYVSVEEVVSKIREVRPSLIGRVLVITGEVQDAKTLERIEHQCLPHIPRHRLREELCDCLSRLLS